MIGILRARSGYSYQDAVCTPMQLAERAAELGHTHLGVTDAGSVMGAVELQKACSAKGLQPIFGATLRVLDELTDPLGTCPSTSSREPASSSRSSSRTRRAGPPSADS